MIDLFDFQKEDVEKLKNEPACLIANDMGTGKTYEAIARDEIFRELWHSPIAKRTLVIAPLTVLPSWQKHFMSLTNLPVISVDPKSRSKSFEDFLSLGDAVFLIHWEALRVFPELSEVYWFHIIADECHRAKNRKAQQTRALKKLKSVFRSALSGTPVVNRPDELWSILNWLKPSEYKGYWKFYNRYVDFEIIYPQGFHKITGPKNELELQKTLSPFMVRRLKKDVLKDLPDKYYTTVWVNLGSKQRKAYKAMARDMVAWVGAHEDAPLVAPVVIAQLIRLQQFAIAHMEEVAGGFGMSEPSAKLDAIMQILEDNPEEQIVIFSQFKQAIGLLGKRLEDKGISYGTITGDVSDKTRAQVIEDFQEGSIRVFAGTIAAGGIGITLTSASTAIFIDRSWSPAINLQAEDRLHRIGQKNAVQIIDIMANETIDLGRQQRLEQKWSWIKLLLGDS